MAKFEAIWTMAEKKDGGTYQFLSLCVKDDKGEYTEIRKIFLTPLEKKVATLSGINLNEIK